MIHTKSINTVLSELSTDAKLGLSGAAAKERLEKNGENRLNEKKKKSLVRRFFEQFYDAMIIILIVAAIVSFAIAIVEGNPKEFFEPCLILVIVILNAVMGVLAHVTQQRKVSYAVCPIHALYQYPAVKRDLRFSIHQGFSQDLEPFHLDYLLILRFHHSDFHHIDNSNPCPPFSLKVY